MNKLFGGILFAAGILIAGASGLCSLAVIISGLSGANTRELGGELSMLLVVLLMGGVPFVIGVVLTIAGRKIIQRDGD